MVEFSTVGILSVLRKLQTSEHLTPESHGWDALLEKPRGEMLNHAASSSGL